MRMHNEGTTMFTSFIRPILFGLLGGLVACIAVLFMLSAVGVAMDIPLLWIIPLSVVATAAGAFVGGFVSGKSAGRNGWLVGLITSFLLFVLSLLAGSSLFSRADGNFMLIKASVMLACGAVGGILAVNCKRRSKKRR